jgi:hypothetical protein
MNKSTNGHATCLSETFVPSSNKQTDLKKAVEELAAHAPCPAEDEPLGVHIEYITREILVPIDKACSNACLSLSVMDYLLDTREDPEIHSKLNEAARVGADRLRGTNDGMPRDDVEAIDAVRDLRELMPSNNASGRLVGGLLDALIQRLERRYGKIGVVRSVWNDLNDYSEVGASLEIVPKIAAVLAALVAGMDQDLKERLAEHFMSPDAIGEAICEASVGHEPRSVVEDVYWGLHALRDVLEEIGPAALPFGKALDRLIAALDAKGADYDPIARVWLPFSELG